MSPHDVAQLLQLLNEQEHIEKPFIQGLLSDAQALNEANETFADALREFRKQSCTRHLAQYRHCFARVDAFLIHLLCVFESDAFRYNRVQKAFFKNFGAKICAYCVVSARYVQHTPMAQIFYKKRIDDVYGALWEICKKIFKELDQETGSFFTKPPYV